MCMTVSMTRHVACAPDITAKQSLSVYKDRHAVEDLDDATMSFVAVLGRLEILKSLD